jgi:hypothetical protein
MLRRGVGDGDRQASGRAMNYNKAVGAARHSILRSAAHAAAAINTHLGSGKGCCMYTAP